MANQALVSLVNALGISRAVVLDEAHEPQLASLLPRLLQIRAMTPEARPTDPLLSGLDFDEDEEVVFRDTAATWWQRTAVGDKRALLGGVSLGQDTPPDDVVYAKLWQQWPQEICPVEFLAPAEWETRWMTLFPGDDSTVLVLLDLNLGENDREGGARILKDLTGLSGGHRIPVIFTYETPEAGEENLWNDLVARHQLGYNWGISISKKRIAKPDMFAKRIASAARTAVAREASDVIADWYQKLIEPACGAFRRNLDGGVFGQVVVRASEQEGVHPQDTLFRLVDRYLRRSRTEIMAEISDELTPYLAKFGTLSSIIGTSIDASTTRATREMRHEELYTTYFGADQTVMPPWLGDVWRIADTLYIHVGQPCDLMLRKDGGRAATFYYFVPLVPGKLSAKSSLVGCPVPYLKVNGVIENDYYADFKDVVVADADIVDCIVLGGRTFSQARINAGTDLPHVIAGVRERHRVALSSVGARWRTTNGSPAPIPPLLLLTRAASVSWSAEEGQPGTYTANAERLARLEGTHAIEVLHRFGASFQRVAHENDYVPK